MLERKILNRIYSQIKENVIWRSRFNYEVYRVHNEPDIVKVNKVGRLRWLGQLCRMQEKNPCRKLNLHKPEGTRRVGRPAVRRLDSVEEGLKTADVRNWGQKSQARDQWRAIIGRRGRGSSWAVAHAEEDHGECVSDACVFGFRE
jgi:hypothetical protein